MPEYSFRIRATDSSGAFADRDFSINVRNTLVDRFLVTDATNAYTSTDGLTWTTRPNQGSSTSTAEIGTPVAQGGGLWMVFNAGPTVSTTNYSYRTSQDGINWTQRTLSIPGVTFTAIKPSPFWVNNRWLIFCTASAGAPATSVITSVDGINWTVANSTATSITMANLSNVTNCVYAAGRYVVGFGGVSGSSSIVGYTSTDLSTWTSITQTGLTGTWSVSDSMYINGVWYFVDALTTTNARVLTSTNLSAFTPRIVVASMPTASRLSRLVYGNGRLVVTLSKLTTGATATFANVYTSDDGGLTWASRSVPSFGTIATNSQAFMGGTFYNGTFYLWLTNQPTHGGLRTSRNGIDWSTPSLTNFPTGNISGFARMALS